MKKFSRFCLQLLEAYAWSLLALLLVGLLAGQTGILLTVPLRCACFALAYALAGLFERDKPHPAVWAVVRWLMRCAAMYAAFYAWRGLAAGDEVMLLLLILFSAAFWGVWFYRFRHPLPPVSPVDTPHPHPFRRALRGTLALFSLISVVLTIWAAADTANATGVNTEWLLRALLFSLVCVMSMQLFRGSHPLLAAAAVFVIVALALGGCLLVGTSMERAGTVALMVFVGYTFCFWGAVIAWRLISQKRAQRLQERGPYRSLYHQD